MAKIKKAYVCQHCGHSEPKWQGRCTGCGSWNSLVEEIVESGPKSKSDIMANSESKLLQFDDLKGQEEERIELIDKELNQVLGNGLVKGSLVLVGGEPGIGKSTLMLQLGLSFADKKVIYVNGEESAHQIKMRAARLSLNQNQSFFLLPETNTSKLFQKLDSVDPDVIIIDSIQTAFSPHLDSMPGSISQIRHCAMEFMQFAKGRDIPIFLIGHITKDGNIAGPKVLEHLVDTVLYFEGDRQMQFRILRAVKNRFGNTSELGIYEMGANGLTEVSNPSALLLSDQTEVASGTAISCSMQGNRTLLVEVQALVSPSAFGQSQRTSNGFDPRRLSMLIAVLEKKGDFILAGHDVFLNITGGIQISDPALDLAVCVALISSLKEIPLAENSCYIGEIGLSGEIRSVSQVDRRVNEAVKLGFKTVYTSAQGKDKIEKSKKINFYSKLAFLIEELF